MSQFEIIYHFYFILQERIRKVVKGIEPDPPNGLQLYYIIK